VYALLCVYMPHRAILLESIANVLHALTQRRLLPPSPTRRHGRRAKPKVRMMKGVVISLGHKAHVATCHTATGFCVVGEEARGRRRREGFLVSAVLVFIRTDYL
jgi:hypothetical protein